jgi:hypothetical protein
MQKAGRLRWISSRFNCLSKFQRSYLNKRQVHIVLTLVWKNYWHIIIYLSILQSVLKAIKPTSFKIFNFEVNCIKTFIFALMWHNTLGILRSRTKAKFTGCTVTRGSQLYTNLCLILHKHTLENLHSETKWILLATLSPEFWYKNSMQHLN